MTSIIKKVPGGWQDIDGGPVHRDTNLFGLDFLHQDEVWTDRDGLEHRLDEMSHDYLLNVRRFLVRRAWWLEMQDTLALLSSVFGPQGDMATYHMERALDEQSEDPEGWLLKTPLLRRIDALLRTGDPADHVPEGEVC